MSRSVRSFGIACWIIFAWFTPGRASAQRVAPDLSFATLEDLMAIKVTTASRIAESLLEAPARVRVISAARIQARGYRSLADVLKDLSDFKVDLAGDQDYPTELTVQGTRGTSRVVLLLDGIRVGSPTKEPLPIAANYPVHHARQIEIVYGPASALYGADAFSAVINIITKDATESPGFSFSSSVGQFGLSNHTMNYGVKFGPNASLVVAGQFLHDEQPDLTRYYPEDFGGLEAQRTGTFNTIFGPMTPSRPVSADYEVPLSAHSVHAVFRAGGLQLTLFENRSRISTTPAYTPDNGVYNADVFNQNELLVASGAYTRVFGVVSSTSTLMMSRHELDPHSGYWNVYSNLARSYKYAYGSTVQVEQQVSWELTRGLQITAGGTHQRFFAIPQGADLNAPITSRDTPGTILGTPFVDDFVKLRYSNSGAYGQIQYAITPQISTTIGARADYNTRFGATFNPRLGVVARPSGRTTLKVLYGTAYLAPSAYQEYSHYGSFYTTDGGATYASDYWHLPNPDLKPQRKQTIETELVQQLGPFISLSVAGFYSRITDLVQESDADTSYSGFYHGWPVAYIDFPVNRGSERIYGGTFEIDALRAFARDRSVRAGISLSLADGRISPHGADGERQQLGAMVPVQLRASTDIEWVAWKFGARLAWVGDQRLMATRDENPGSPRRTLDGYATVDVNVRRERILGNLNLFASVENALDRRYRHINARAYSNPEELIGAPQNPRRFSVGVDVRVR
jgi:outer membrane cobalamin receptor